MLNRININGVKKIADEINLCTHVNASTVGLDVADELVETSTT
jgi:hypothetical protein